MFTTQTITVADGLRLSVRLYGDRTSARGRPLICLAGLTRNARDFHELAERLLREPAAPPRLILALDSRGRGQSDRDPDPSRYTVPVEAGDVLAVMDALAIAEADFIGTSRGGLILHVLAGMAPERLGALVLNDIGPVIGLEGMRHIQSYLDPTPRPRPRREIAAALKIVHGEAFPALSGVDWDDMVDCLCRPDGSPAIASAAITSASDANASASDADASAADARASDANARASATDAGASASVDSTATAITSVANSRASAAITSASDADASASAADARASDANARASATDAGAGPLLVPDFDPAIAGAVKATDLSKPLPDLWPLFDLMKTKRLLVIRGEHSRLLTAETLDEMRKRHPGLQCAMAIGQGHAPLLHLEPLPSVIARFLADG